MTLQLLFFKTKRRTQWSRGSKEEKWCQHQNICYEHLGVTIKQRHQDKEEWENFLYCDCMWLKSCKFTLVSLPFKSGKRVTDSSRRFSPKGHGIAAEKAQAELSNPQPFWILFPTRTLALPLNCPSVRIAQGDVQMRQTTLTSKRRSSAHRWLDGRKRQTKRWESSQTLRRSPSGAPITDVSSGHGVRSDAILSTLCLLKLNTVGKKICSGFPSSKKT